MNTIPEMASTSFAVAAIVAEPQRPMSPAPTSVAGGPGGPVSGLGGVGEGEGVGAEGDDPPHPYTTVAQAVRATPMDQQRRALSTAGSRAVGRRYCLTSPATSYLGGAGSPQATSAAPTRLCDRVQHEFRPFLREPLHGLD